MAEGLSTRITVIKKEQRGLVPSELIHKLEVRALSHAEDVLDSIRDYPPTQSATYVRTGDLGRAWEIKRVVEAGAIRYRIVNDVEGDHGQKYAVYVVGKWQTAAARRLQWKKISEVMDRGALARIMQQEIKAAIARGL